jgi:hypothetical protein
VLAVAIGNESLCPEAGAVRLLFISAQTGEQLELRAPPGR